jgi:hypothetical protein
VTMPEASVLPQQPDQIVTWQRRIEPILNWSVLPVVVIFLLAIIGQFSGNETFRNITLAFILPAIAVLYLHVWSLKVSTRHRLPAAATAEEIAVFERNQAAFLESVKREFERKAQKQITDSLRAFDAAFARQIREAVERRLGEDLLHQLDEKLSNQITDSASKARISQSVKDRAAQSPVRMLEFASKAEDAATWNHRVAMVFAFFGIAAAISRMLGWPPLSDDWISRINPDALETHLLWAFALRNAPIVALVVLSESLALLFLRQSAREIERLKYFSHSATLIEQRFTGAALAIERGTDKDISETIEKLLELGAFTSGATPEKDKKREEEFYGMLGKLGSFLERYVPRPAGTQEVKPPPTSTG